MIKVEMEKDLDTQKIIDQTVYDLMSIETITAIGLTHKLDVELKPDEGDIDVFIFCQEIPGSEQRQPVLDKLLKTSLISDLKLNVYEGGYWGIVDYFRINGVETWLMFFTTNEFNDYLDAVLAGNLLDDDNGFYPTGRCATILNMEVLKDKTGFIESLKQKIQIYPDSLRENLARHHLDLALDEEDFGRAVLRKDVLFYHQVLENALDHFLQALFAVNQTYFPSRKRTLEFIEKFEIKPDQCADRLTRVVELGSRKEGIAESSRIWHEMVCELIDLYRDTVTWN